MEELRVFKKNSNFHFARFKSELLKRFRNCINDSERSEDVSIRKLVDMAMFVERWQEGTAISLRDRVHEAMRLEDAGEEIDFVLSVSDVTEIGLRISHTGLVEYAEASGSYFGTSSHFTRNFIYSRAQQV